MDMFTIVRPEHLNHFGNLFGGHLLLWVDQYAWLAATREFPGTRLVTKAMDEVVFTRGVLVGSMLRFAIQRQTIGNTSVTYRVDVYAQESGALEEYPVFETQITFVCVDAEGNKQTVPKPVACVQCTCGRGRP
jgi:acyl-CoA hydrolase